MSRSLSDTVIFLERTQGSGSDTKVCVDHRSLSDTGGVCRTWETFTDTGPLSGTGETYTGVCRTRVPLCRTQGPQSKEKGRTSVEREGRTLGTPLSAGGVSS